MNNTKKSILIVVSVVIVLIGLCFLCITIGRNIAMKNGRELYYSQYHGTKDNNKSYEYFTYASKMGAKDAYYYLGKLDERTYDYENAYENYQLGLEKGSQLSELALGELYLNGNGVDQDLSKAKQLFDSALDNDCVEANYYIGYMIKKVLNDEITNYDDDAIVYLEKAAQSNEAEIAAKALYQIGNIYLNGNNDVAADTDKAVEYFLNSIEMYPYTEGYIYNMIAMVCEDDNISHSYYEKAEDFYKKAAEAGDANSMYNLGILYHQGNVGEADYEEALKWYEKSADAGSPDAMYAIGLLYYEGVLGKADYKEAEKWYKKGAKAGNTNSMYFLGKIYQQGDLGEADYEEAAKWYEKGAKAGNTIAMFQLGWLYLNDYLGDEKFEEAEEWFKKGAELRDVSSMAKLGWIYKNDYLGKPDYKASKKWLKHAAEAGDVNSTYLLGMLYESGDLGEPDYEEAAKWYKKGAEAGSDVAMTFLGMLYEDGDLGEPDYEEAAKWYEEAAKLGSVISMNSLGDLYKNGKLGKADYKKAEKWYKMGAELGDTDAMYSLGLLYENGDLGQPDYDKALEWYEKAIASDDCYFKDTVKEHIKKVTELQNNENKKEEDEEISNENAYLNDNDNVNNFTEIKMSNAKFMIPDSISIKTAVAENDSVRFEDMSNYDIEVHHCEKNLDSTDTDIVADNIAKFYSEYFDITVLIDPSKCIVSVEGDKKKYIFLNAQYGDIYDVAFAYLCSDDYSTLFYIIDADDTFTDEETLIMLKSFDEYAGNDFTYR